MLALGKGIPGSAQLAAHVYVHTSGFGKGVSGVYDTVGLQRSYREGRSGEWLIPSGSNPAA